MLVGRVGSYPHWITLCGIDLCVSSALADWWKSKWENISGAIPIPIELSEYGGRVLAPLHSITLGRLQMTWPHLLFKLSIKSLWSRKNISNLCCCNSFFIFLLYLTEVLELFWRLSWAGVKIGRHAVSSTGNHSHLLESTVLWHTTPDVCCEEVWYLGIPWPWPPSSCQKRSSGLQLNCTYNSPQLKFKALICVMQLSISVASLGVGKSFCLMATSGFQNSMEGHREGTIWGNNFFIKINLRARKRAVF